MTIIQPNKNSFKIEFFSSVLMMIFIASAVWGVFLYNQTVNFKHEMKNVSITLKQREVENAELKNILYSMVDLKESESLVASESLILEKNPEYVKVSNSAKQQVVYGTGN